MKKEGVNMWKALGFETYQDYLASDFWKEKRDWILSCFENECQKCGSRKDLQVHHKNYNSVGNEKMRDLIVLCRKCHKEVHDGSSD